MSESLKNEIQHDVSKTAAKAKKAPAKVTVSNGQVKNTSLRGPQIRVLKALSKSNKALTRSQISEKGQVDLAMLNSYIGSADPVIRAKNDKAVCISLVTLGYVKTAPNEEEKAAISYRITPKGTAALAKA